MPSSLEPTPRQGGNHISTPPIDRLHEHLGLPFGDHGSQIAVTPGTGAEHNSYRRMSSIIWSIRLEYQTMLSPSGSSWRDGKILLIVAEKTPRKNVTGVGVTAKPMNRQRIDRNEVSFVGLHHCSLFLPAPTRKR